MDKKKFHRSCVLCHVSCVTCHVSPVTCHVSRDMCHTDLHCTVLQSQIYKNKLTILNIIVKLLLPFCNGLLTLTVAVNLLLMWLLLWLWHLCDFLFIWYRCYCPETSRDSGSYVCGIFYYGCDLESIY